MNANLLSRSIRELRKKQGLSLAELARRVGTSPATISRYEHGWERFEVYTLEKIASALGCNLEIKFKYEKKAPAEKGFLTVRNKLERLFWDHNLSTKDFAEYPGWIIERIIEYGDLTDVYSLLNIYGREKFLKALAEARFQSPKTESFWKTVLEREGVKCTKRSLQRKPLAY